VFKDTIVLDSVAPSVSGPTVAIRSGARVRRSGARIPALANMSASDATSGLALAKLKTTCDGTKRAGTSALAGTTELGVDLNLSGCRITARADDVAGHSRTEALTPRIFLFDSRKKSKRIRLKGGWAQSNLGDAVKNTITRTSKRGAFARLAFNGAQFAVVARRGPSGGLLKVILDGEHIGTIDLYAKERDDRRITYVRNVPKGKHVLKLTATGKGSADSSGATIWLDAILVMDRRS
jgi:hypothetical protein